MKVMIHREYVNSYQSHERVKIDKSSVDLDQTPIRVFNLELSPSVRWLPLAPNNAPTIGAVR